MAAHAAAPRGRQLRWVAVGAVCLAATGGVVFGIVHHEHTLRVDHVASALVGANEAVGVARTDVLDRTMTIPEILAAYDVDRSVDYRATPDDAQVLELTAWTIEGCSDDVCLTVDQDGQEVSGAEQ